MQYLFSNGVRNVLPSSVHHVKNQMAELSQYEIDMVVIGAMAAMIQL